MPVPRRPISLRKFLRNPSLIDGDKAVQRLAQMVADEARIAVNTGGRVGKIRDDGRRASVVGEAPHTKTGELVGSIHSGKTFVAANAAHAAFHETNNREFLTSALRKVFAEGKWLRPRRRYANVRIL